MMRTATQCLLATALLWAGTGYAQDAEPNHSTQAAPAPIVGLGFSNGDFAVDGEIGENVISAIKMDSQVTGETSRPGLRWLVCEFARDKLALECHLQEQL